MRDAVVALTEAQAKEFCLRLWLELTIAGRSIWSDETLAPASQLASLKWLNEIQHFVWNAHSRFGPDAMALLLNRIVEHCENAPNIKPHVRIALDRSLAKAKVQDGSAQ